jgi:anti-sigma B factor antagonist
VINAFDPTRWRADPLPDAPLVDAVDSPAAVGDRPAGYTPQRQWGLSVQHHPAVAICAVVVEGELDLLTAPLLERSVREQLLAAPAHLILDLESVCFVGSSGLTCLLTARELAQTSGVQLHLAGLITRVVARPVEITGLLAVFSTYPTLIHAMMELADPDARSKHMVPPPVLTAFWRRLMGSVWILELCKFDTGTAPAAAADWINSGVPATQPAPDTAHELLAAYGLWLFHDPSKEIGTGGRHRIGYTCTDAELVLLADLMRHDAAQARLHPMMLASWVAAGYSTTTAVGWIRAGCPFPR